MSQRNDPSPKVDLAELEREIEILGPRISERRRQRIDSVLRYRLSSLTVVLENIHKVHNLSAVLRTAEGMGIQNVHIAGTPEDGATIAKGVSQGADKWLSVFKWDGIEDAVSALRKQGFSIAASVLDEESIPLQEIDFSNKVALVFGNELEGLSKQAIELADIKFKIPMWGFVQSYNISVACAITLWHAANQRRTIIGKDGDLPDAQLLALKAKWYKQSVKFAEEILQRILEDDETQLPIEFEK